ncbi:MAG TPA: hypothetical protein VMT89_07345 [Candidatus Acidoferrales bacterium]|nr:hypothetical protein [Candidatus Acidoferrales bacterium]
MRVIVAGAIAAHPLGGGGNTWAFLQYVLGFKRLGCETYYVEEIDAGRCIDADWKPSSFAVSANAQYFAATMQGFGFSERAALLESGSGESIGLRKLQLEEVAQDADLLVNLSGRFHQRSILDRVRRRMYVDLDPGFVQIWQAQYNVDMNLARHDVHVTVGLNLGADSCPMPTCGIDWHTTLPPVVLDEWQTTTPAGSAYTTVADWRGYSPVEWQGQWYGQKSEEFLRIIDLPRHSKAPIELCLAIHPEEADRQRLLDHGWRLVEPRQRIATPDAYRNYVQTSRGELTVAKNGYVAGRTGWFSDRSACYLAAGRPVIVQDTTIGGYVPTGEGLLTFTDTASAAAALERVEANYERHAETARQFAREYLDSDRVLARLIELARL